MTPAAIRAAAGQTHYTVICDVCHGKMFRDGMLCMKCDGDGRLLVPETRSIPLSERGKFAIVLVTAICIIATAVFLSLM